MSPRKPRILFVGLNYPPESIGIAAYSGGLCEELAKAGFDVRAVVANPYYPAWKTFAGFRSILPRRTRENGVDLTRVPIYVPKTPSGVKRILHHVSFALSAWPSVLARAIGRRPDVVITVAPSLIGAPIALLAARLRGATAWLHVQDFEVGAAFATGLMQATGMGARLALGFEKHVVKAFDRVSSISFEMCRRLRDIGVAPDRVHEFRNWTDTTRISPLEAPSGFREKWGIEVPHVALYSGNIANKQGIEIVVQTARLLAHRGDLTFVICGEGPNLVSLQQLAGGLRNIQFHPLQPYEDLNELVGLATVHLLPQKASAADLLLPSKLTNILASARPVVAGAAPGTGLAREVEGCGLAVEPENADAMAAAIVRLIDDPALYAQCSTNARNRAISDWDKQAIIGKFEQLLIDVMPSHSAPLLEVSDG